MQITHFPFFGALGVYEDIAQGRALQDLYFVTPVSYTHLTLPTIYSV